MSTIDPVWATVAELSRAFAARTRTPVDVVDALLERVRKRNPALHAFIAVYDAEARLAAEAADKAIRARHRVGPLHGVPIALKDLVDLEGRVTTGGSKVWAERVSPVTATLAERLIAAGMIVLGKTHTVEFAMGSFGTNTHLGTPRNPWDLAVHRTPGGSSSGSGVAVAAGLAPAAIGSDTGGSVRIPAVLNSITGLKTTYGLISLHGAVPLSTTLDSIGPMTRTAADAALLTAAMMGPDRNDPNTLTAPALDFGDLFGPPPDISGMRIAVLPAKQFPLEPEADVVSAWSAAIATLRSLGAVVEERAVPFDFNEVMLRNGRLIAAEAWALHRAYIEDVSLPIGQFVRAR